ncbi:MAG: V-type ATPase subunit [Candidatus Bathyarchaeia archaeon]|nr:V-type ATPase subunit [Candidatus Bathyarchaeota archaeon]
MPEYLIVRCHGLKTHLLPNQAIEALASSKNIKEFADVLASTDYGNKIRELKEINAYELEQIFTDELIKRYSYVVNAASNTMQDFLKVYAKRFEIEALTKILRSKTSKTTTSKNIKSFLPSIQELSTLNLDRLIEAETIERTIELLKGTAYFKIVKSLEFYQKYNSVLPLETHLKKIYYEMVFQALETLPNEDQEEIKKLLGIEIDALNCFTALSPILYNYAPELTKQMLIPFFFKVPLSSLKEVIESKSLHTALTVFKGYENVIKPLVEKGDEVLTEINVFKLLKEKADEIMVKSSINFAYAIAYLALCEIEWRNLTLIAFLTQQNIEAKPYLIL